MTQQNAGSDKRFDRDGPQSVRSSKHFDRKDKKIEKIQTDQALTLALSDILRNFWKGTMNDAHSDTLAHKQYCFSFSPWLTLFEKGLSEFLPSTSAQTSPPYTSKE